eukprot:CAMPEP_0183736438 /NCGR_PEP_ID=MMETSP0737-20130205/49277_1 /TAXON_ID=385413 /ORGANISM="Thalassiosira miniscula, Strain CCMP1093" /LENGTH=43 /DNA_ID= /DNA_START= /DNA_END= /DNA_ORIENTATION=
MKGDWGAEAMKALVTPILDVSANNTFLPASSHCDNSPSNATLG